MTRSRLCALLAGALLVAGCGGNSRSTKYEPGRTTSGGGGNGESAHYRARVIIGAPSPSGIGESETHRAKLGAGPAQHGQH